MIEEDISNEMKKSNKDSNNNSNRNENNIKRNENNENSIEEKEPQDNRKKKKRSDLPRDTDENQTQTQYDNISDISKNNRSNLSNHESNISKINISEINNSNSKNNIDEKLIEIEDGYGKESFFKDEYSVLTIKILKNNFELIDIKDLNIEKEEEKRKTNELILKLVSNMKPEKDYQLPENFNMESEEIELIKILLNDHHNKVVFLHIMNQFRTTGNLLMQKKTFDIFSKLFYSILDKYEQDKDIFAIKNIIVLSQTYFYIDENNKKEYLQVNIIKHPLFKDLTFGKLYLILK
jgi:hypothetical protein